jgi:hypothetical protein
MEMAVREYVLVSWKWSWKKDHLVFWGKETRFEEPRSYGGYTMDLNSCEKYTSEDITNKGHVFWNNQKPHELDRSESYAVKISDLHNFGKTKTIVWRD